MCVSVRKIFQKVTDFYEIFEGMDRGKKINRLDFGNDLEPFP